MASLLNSINHLRKKVIPKFHRFFRKKDALYEAYWHNPKRAYKKTADWYSS